MLARFLLLAALTYLVAFVVFSFNVISSSIDKSLIANQDHVFMAGLCWSSGLTLFVTAVSLLMLLLLWSVLVPKPHYPFFRFKDIQSPGKPNFDLPAAALSVLSLQELTNRVWLTIMVEMCEKGLLRIQAVRKDTNVSGRHLRETEFDYLVSATGRPELDWEIALHEQLSGNQSPSKILDWASHHTPDTMKDKLADYLATTGLYDRSPFTYAPWVNSMRIISYVMLFGALIALLFPIFFSGKLGFSLIQFTVLGIGYGALIVCLVELSIERIGRVTQGQLTAKGTRELNRWKRFLGYIFLIKSSKLEQYLSEHSELLPYMVALGLNNSPKFPKSLRMPWFDLPDSEQEEQQEGISAASRGSVVGDLVLVGFLRSSVWRDASGSINAGSLDSFESDVDFDVDFDFDFDLSI